jgi:uncharacterized membrane protein
MTERIPDTAHGDAPLSAAYHPDARASGLPTARLDDELIGRTVTINAPLQMLLEFWRTPGNVQRVLGGDSARWQSLQVEEGPGTALAWRAAPDDEGHVSGRIEFRPAPAGRGTEVTISLATEPRGLITKTMDLLQHKDPTLETRRLLRRFKQLVETGEIATAAPGPAAPRGG